MLRLRAIDFRQLPLLPDYRRHPRQQAAPARRNHDGVELRQLLEQFKSQRSVAANRALVVERVDDQLALLAAEALDHLGALGELVRAEDNLRSQPPRRLHLVARSEEHTSELQSQS